MSSPTRIGIRSLAALVVSFGASLATAQRAPVVIETMAVHEEATETAVYLNASEMPEWELDLGTGGLVELVLTNAVPGPAVSDLFPAAGLIESARVRLDEATATPRTIVAVQPRQPVEVSATAAAGELVLRLRTASSVAPTTQDPPTPVDPQSAPRPAPGPASSETADDGRYRIGPGDVLRISVFGLDDLTRRVRVSRDGSVSLPLLGNLQLVGLTPTEAESSVASKLTAGQLVNDPQVTVFVEEYVSRGISIQGAVNRPGVFQMIEQRTLLEMLGHAGGLSGKETDRAGQRIFVLRTKTGGAQQRIEVDSGRLIDEGDASLNMLLRPGDVVMVPHAKKLRVYVTGAIENPGHIEYLSSEGITVLQAITAAGGPTERSNLRRVHILRRGADGAQLRIPVNVKQIQKGRADDPLLESNDTVVVGEWFF